MTLLKIAKACACCAGLLLLAIGCGENDEVQTSKVAGSVKKATSGKPPSVKADSSGGPLATGLAGPCASR